MRAEALLLKSLQRSLFADHRYPQWQEKSGLFVDESRSYPLQGTNRARRRTLLKPEPRTLTQFPPLHRSSNIGVSSASSSQWSEGNLIGTTLTFLGYQRKTSG